MKRLLFLLMLSPAVWLTAQSGTPTCKPDNTLADTLYGVFPLPYSSRNPKGGITDTACLNTYFDYVFTIKVPDVFPIPGIGEFPIVSVSLNPDTAVANLPQGLDYVCNPPTCVFPKGTSGCIILFGSATNASQVGRHDLKIRGLVTSFVPIAVTFPDSTLFAPGNYYLYIQPEGSPACKPSSVGELAATQLQMHNVPNPFSSLTEIEVNSGIRGRFDFRVFDFMGKVMHRENVQIYQGQNRISFDGSQLPNGIYTYSLTDGLRSVARKMVIHR